MNCSENQRKHLHTPSEDLFRDRLINSMLTMWTVLAFLVFVLTQVRALTIGWTARDLVYFIIVATIIATASCRRKLSTRFKAITILIFNIIVGVVGVYTLGMFAGSIFFFPLSVVIIALFYPARTVAFWGVLSIVFLCLIAIGFSSNHLKLNPNADFLLTNYAHWSVYILCFAFFFLITSVTILNYRQAMRSLVADVEYQLDKLAKSNKDLQSALDEITTLRGIIPICSYCKNIRDDKGVWNQLEAYIHSHSEAEFSHGICPECFEKQMDELDQEITEPDATPDLQRS